MGIEALAATVVGQVIGPFVERGAAGVAEALRKRLDEAAASEVAERAGRVWDRVKQLFTAGGDEDVVEQFEKRPQAAGCLMKTVLQEKLEADPELAAELEELVTKPAPGVSGDIGKIIAENVGIVNVGGDLTGTATGLQQTYNYGTPPSSG